MKAHIGVDAESGLVHMVVGTAANVNDVTQGHSLLHGEEEVVFANAGYQGSTKRAEATGGGLARSPAAWQALVTENTPWGQIIEQVEKLKASIRAGVEYPFRVIKRQFGFVKILYRGLKTNPAQVVTLFELGGADINLDWFMP